MAHEPDICEDDDLEDEEVCPECGYPLLPGEGLLCDKCVAEGFDEDDYPI